MIAGKNVSVHIIEYGSNSSADMAPDIATKKQFPVKLLCNT